MVRPIGRPVALVLLIALSTSVYAEPTRHAPAGNPLATLPILELKVGPHRIAAEHAVTTEALLTGLMWRHSLAPDAGMLFKFPPHIRRCMVMRNTFIPLSVAFLDAQGSIIQINEMKPLTEQEHCAGAKAEYALEMNAGWFTRKSVKPGARLIGIEKAQE
jgi:hypothetical protein